jgi:hypothetical protein
VDERADIGPVELTRGPVHEGFAERPNLEAKPYPPAPTHPPEPLNEVPADVKPDDPNAEWLPGYWSWQATDKQFVWLTGTWRVPPPEHRWVPGYWTEADNAQWIPGFWAADSADELAYLPPPPPYREENVDIANPPQEDAFWVQGCWIFAETGYTWRAGYWARAVPGWMWIPAQYVWTPLGCLFVDGYWDFPLEDRGTLFAPVLFETSVYQQVAFVYTPSYLIDLGLLADNLFVNLAYPDYFFGDYYGTGGYFYDPLFAYNNWYYRRENPHWRDEFRRRYDRLRRDVHERPPHTVREQLALGRGAGNFAHRKLAVPVRDALRRDLYGGHFGRLTLVDRRYTRDATDFYRGLTLDRRRFERAVARPTGVGRPLAVRRALRLPRSFTPWDGGRLGRTQRPLEPAPPVSRLGEPRTGVPQRSEWRFPGPRVQPHRTLPRVAMPHVPPVARARGSIHR